MGAKNQFNRPAICLGSPMLTYMMRDFSQLSSSSIGSSIIFLKHETQALSSIGRQILEQLTHEILESKALIALISIERHFSSYVESKFLTLSLEIILILPATPPPGMEIYEFQSLLRVVSTSKLAPDQLHKSEQPNRSKVSKLT